MRERGGAIVALSSIAASLFQARNGQGAAAKAGTEALVRVLAREEGRHNIRVNAVAVGLTESPSTEEAFAKWGADSSARVVAGIPLKRIATPQDVANVVMFLVGPSGRYITGKVIAADGGQYIGH
jgi:3-oxoacyl-[acyl-carrier protein] reductase